MKNLIWLAGCLEARRSDFQLFMDRFLSGDKTSTDRILEKKWILLYNVKDK
jgi:hypothetical protein